MRAELELERSMVAEQSAALAELDLDEGVLSFVTFIYCNHRDSPYERECGRDNDGRPSSEQAERAHLGRGEVERA